MTNSYDELMYFVVTDNQFTRRLDNHVHLVMEYPVAFACFLFLSLCIIRERGRLRSKEYVRLTKPSLNRFNQNLRRSVSLSSLEVSRRFPPNLQVLVNHGVGQTETSLPDIQGWSRLLVWSSRETGNLDWNLQSMRRTSASRPVSYPDYAVILAIMFSTLRGFGWRTWKNTFQLWSLWSGNQWPHWVLWYM